MKKLVFVFIALVLVLCFTLFCSAAEMTDHTENATSIYSFFNAEIVNKTCDDKSCCFSVNHDDTLDVVMVTMSQFEQYNVGDKATFYNRDTFNTRLLDTAQDSAYISDIVKSGKEYYAAVKSGDNDTVYVRISSVDADFDLYPGKTVTINTDNNGKLYIDGFSFADSEAAFYKHIAFFGVVSCIAIGYYVVTLYKRRRNKYAKRQSF